VIELSLTDVVPQAKKRGVEIDVEVATDVGPIVADRDKLRRVVTNLLANAVKFSRRLGRSLSVPTWSTRRAGTKAASICSRGPATGICACRSSTPASVSRLTSSITFGGVLSGDNSSTASSAHGLGLAIVRNFIQAHGGRVEVTSHVGSGSTFTVLPPLRQRVLADEVASRCRHRGGALS